MAASDSIICNVCVTKSDTNVAVKWCFECMQTMCSECLDNHNSSEITSNHTAIDIENYVSLPSCILDIKPSCDEHRSRFQHYCTNHDCPCCSECITSNHQGCNSILSLDTLVPNAKSSTALIDIEERLKNLNGFIRNISTEKETNIADISTEEDNILEQVKQIRHTINQHFDKLEKDIILNLSEVGGKHRIRIDKICTELNQQEQNVIELQNSISKMKTFASDLHFFLGIKKLEEEVSKNEKNVEEISTDKILNTQHMEFQENVQLATLLSSLSSLGELSVSSRPSDIRKHTPKVNRAQINTSSINNFGSLTLVDQTKINLRLYKIFGCALTENGEAVFSDYNRRLLLIKNIYNGQTYNINFTTAPYDVACIDAETLAVSSCSSNTISIVNLRSRKVERTVIDERCFGLCTSNGKLVYSTKQHGLKTMDLSSSENIIKLNIGNYIADEYVAARNNKIYCTNNRTSSVTCYNADHSLAWVFQKSILKGPRGITVDDRSNVYICNRDADNIVVISPDGRKYKTFDVQIKRPRTLYFEDQSKLILICGEKEDAEIFSIVM